jgi:hypothetical protein
MAAVIVVMCCVVCSCPFGRIGITNENFSSVSHASNISKYRECGSLELIHSIGARGLNNDQKRGKKLEDR